MEKYKIVWDCYIWGWEKWDIFEWRSLYDMNEGWFDVKTKAWLIVPQFIEGENIQKVTLEWNVFDKSVFFKDISEPKIGGSNNLVDSWVVTLSNNCNCGLCNWNSLSTTTKKMSKLRDYIWSNFMFDVEDDLADNIEFIEEKQDEIDSMLVCLSVISAKSDDVIDEIEDAVENKDKLEIKELMKELAENKEIYKTDSYNNMIKAIKKFLQDNWCNDWQD